MMEKKYFLYFLLFIVGLCPFMASCSLFNPPVVVPCYGHIDSLPLIVTNTATYGTSANGINSAWVYVDDNPVGAFEMPVTFPMIATTGIHKITIFAGVSDYGDPGNRLKYPFYNGYTVDVNLTQGAVTTFKPTTSYTTYAHLPWNENFDSELQPGITTNNNVGVGTTDTSMFIIKNPNPNVYQGVGSGEVYLDGVKHQNYVGVSADSFNLPNNGSPVFLEINYKSNCVFGVGMISIPYSNINPYTPELILYVDTASTWKKMYINLQPTVSTLNSQTNGYYVYFQMQNTSGTPTEFYIDNVKLVREN